MGYGSVYRCDSLDTMQHHTQMIQTEEPPGTSVIFTTDTADSQGRSYYLATAKSSDPTSAVVKA